MDHQATAAEIKRAQSLHSALLFDFIVIHVFLFVLALSVLKLSLIPITLMPILSISLLAYVLIKARRALTHEPSYFVRCHMLLAAKRARMFLILFLVTGSFTTLMFIGGPQLGISPIASKALAVGIGQLPFMVTLLVLVVMEFDAEHQCKSSKIPTAAIALHPTPTEV